jgi:hypothetical protein
VWGQARQSHVAEEEAKVHKLQSQARKSGKTDTRWTEVQYCSTAAMLVTQRWGRAVALDVCLEFRLSGQGLITQAVYTWIVRDLGTTKLPRARS